MDYQINSVSDQLVYIRWFREPEEERSVEKFLQDLKQVLDNSPHPVYILSDLREGRLKNVGDVRRLAELVSNHPRFASGTSFSQDAYTPVFVDLFSKFAHQTDRASEIWPTLEQALGYLEVLAPGVTQGIDWVEIVNTLE
ncbi:MAG: hypothetical protein HY866_05380 [Chloroflexi bacterium]|nr:hypothetical protein [Chloroflexota bacterium]